MKKEIMEYVVCPKCSGQGAIEPEDGQFCVICRDAGKIIKSNYHIEITAVVGCHKCGKPAKAPYSYWASEKLIGGDYCEEHLAEIKNACKNCHEFISKGILVGCKKCDNTRLEKHII